jgi:hypothetical protein
MSKVTFNGDTKIITINDGITSIDVTNDLYSEWKDWLVLGDNLKYKQAFRYLGGDSIGSGQRIASYFFLMNGWKIKPYEGNHTLDILGNLFSDDNSDPFINTIGSFNVFKRMITSSNSTTTTINVNTGSGLTPEEHEQLMKTLTRSFYLANKD